ncbi:hypothetical protein WD019_19885 [Fictibacillus sp. Mic-4]|uniref:hypothetical protein n=1 Tax=Fictibacillus TaxID=1329200 RepID=UPI00040498D9|nr:hypothetical protein [Fictibacillus gelatini]
MDQATHFISIFERSIKKKEVLSTYLNQFDPEKCSVGFIESISSEQFIMKHVTPEGMSDGYIVRKLEDVFRIDSNGEYEKRIKLLYTLQNQKHEDFTDKNTISGNTNLFKESLMIAKKKDLIVSVCIDETETQDDIIGFVKDVNSEEVTISRISFEGFSDGESTFYLEDINKLNCDTSDEKIIKLLYNHRKSNK